MSRDTLSRSIFSTAHLLALWIKFLVCEFGDINCGFNLLAGLFKLRLSGIGEKNQAVANKEQDRTSPAMDSGMRTTYPVD